MSWKCNYWNIAWLFNIIFTYNITSGFHLNNFNHLFRTITTVWAVSPLFSHNVYPGNYLLKLINWLFPLYQFLNQLRYYNPEEMCMWTFTVEQFNFTLQLWTLNTVMNYYSRIMNIYRKMINFYTINVDFTVELWTFTIKLYRILTVEQWSSQLTLTVQLWTFLSYIILYNFIVKL